MESTARKLGDQPGRRLSLYDLDQVYRDVFARRLALLEQIEDNGGEASDGQLDELAELEVVETRTVEQIERKALSIATLCKEQLVELDKLQAEQERLQRFAEAVAVRRHRLERELERWERYLAGLLSGLGIRELEDRQCRVLLRESPGEVQVVDERLVPERYWRQVPERTIPPARKIDRNLALRDLRGGQGRPPREIPGLRLVRKRGIVIS